MRAPRSLQRGRDEFGVILAGSFAALLIAPFELHSIRPVIMLMLSGLLQFTLWTAGLPHRVMVLALISTGTVVALAAANEFNTNDRLPRIAFSVSAVVVLLVIVGILIYRLSAHPRVNIRTICGALSLYVLLGLIFTYADVLLAETRNRSFFTQPDTHSPVEYLYFSYSTLTTVGYGDLTAADDPARMFAVVEALLGQTYLVSVVALVVGNIGRDRRSRDSDQPVGEDRAAAGEA